MSDSEKDLERLERENEELRQRIEALEQEKDTLGRETAASWRILVDEAPVCISTVGLDQRFLTCNAAFCAFLGFSEEELKQKTIAEVTLPEDRPIGMVELGEIMAGKRPSARVEKRYVRKDGAVVWGEVHIKLVRDAQGKPVHFLPIVLDVTDRKHAEAELRESLILLRSAGSIARFGGWNVDVATNRSHWSDEVARIHEMPVGYAPLVEDGIKFYAPQWRARIIEVFTACLRDGVPYDERMEILTSTGKRVWVRTCGEAVRDESGKIVKVQGGFQDITEQKRTEEARLRLEEQLRASQKMEAIGILAGGVAHDFNNLLSVILSYTGFVMDSLSDDDPRKADLLEVEKASNRAVALTRQLLAFSRKQVLQPVALDLNQVAGGLEKMLRRILGEDIEFVQVLAPGLGRTLADPGQIEQVLMNLVVNARDAMPDGGRLTIETSNVEIDPAQAATLAGVNPGSYVEIAVTDSGFGMDSPTREHIFEPFFTTKEKGRGTGLGLSTVFGIVKQSCGEILVESAPGRGTTFRILLPRIPGDSNLLPVNPEATPKAITGGTETILVVEDEEGLRNVALRVLTQAGYSVLAAASGKEALRLCEQHAGRIQLLLTDVIMPEMSGKELAEHLARTCPAVKVLFMSGYTQDTIVHHGVLDPAVHFLGKPFTAAALRQKVRGVLDH